MSHWRPVEFPRRTIDEDALDKLERTVLQFGHLAGQMEFVILRIHAQLFPDGKNIEKCIVNRGDSIGILELEAVVLKTEHLHLAVMEIGIELAVGASKTLLVHVAPYRRHERLIADASETAGQHLT